MKNQRFKRLATLLMLSLTLFTTACADSKVIQGQTYQPYGLIDKEDVKAPDVQYQVVWGNVIWGGLLFGSAVAPIYFFGFSLWEPVGPKPLQTQM